MFGCKKRRKEREAFDKAYFQAEWENHFLKNEKTIEHLSRLEASLNPEQKAWAIAYATSLGWGGAAPQFVWRDIFMQASKKFNRPTY